VSDVHFCTTDKLILVKKGGNFQGTWMHEDIAMEFARWLSAKFAVWCNRMVKEMVIESRILPVEIERLSLKEANYQVKLFESRISKLHEEILIRDIQANVVRIANSLCLFEGHVWNEVWDKLKVEYGFDVEDRGRYLSKMEYCRRGDRLRLMMEITAWHKRTEFI
jgi:hypothetical protein